MPTPFPYSGGTYLKLRVRKRIDYPLLGVAVALTLDGPNGTIKDIKLALTGAEKAPYLVNVADY